MSVFVARMSSLSFLRSETQVPSPPPILPSASSGPRLAPPASDTSETATAFRTVEGSTRWSLQLLDGAGQLGREPKQPPKHADEHPGRRGHRHPPEAPVQPAGVLRKREPEVGPALDQPQERQAGEREHDPEQRRIPHQPPEPRRPRQRDGVGARLRPLARAGTRPRAHERERDDAGAWLRPLAGARTRPRAHERAIIARPPGRRR